MGNHRHKRFGTAGSCGQRTCRRRKVSLFPAAPAQKGSRRSSPIKPGMARSTAAPATTPMIKKNIFHTPAPRTLLSENLLFLQDADNPPPQAEDPAEERRGDKGKSDRVRVEAGMHHGGKDIRARNFKSDIDAKHYPADRVDAADDLLAVVMPRKMERSGS